MMRARQLAAFLLFVPLASAQERGPAPAEVKGISVTTQEGAEIRIQLNVSGSAEEAKVVATYPDSLILDVDGAVYRGLPRRIPVNAAGVRAVRLWMQSEVPPLTRVVVEIDQSEKYLISSDGGTIVLRVGPSLPGAAGSTAPATSDVTGSTERPVPAGRGSASTNAVRALEGIFRHGASKPPTYSNSKIRDGQLASLDNPGAQTAQSQNIVPGTAGENTPLPTTVATPAGASNEQPSATNEAGKEEISAETRAEVLAILNPGELPASIRLPATLPPPIPARTENAKIPAGPAAPATPPASDATVAEAASTEKSNPGTETSTHPSAPPATETVTSTAVVVPAGAAEPAGPTGETAVAAPARVAIVPAANPGMRTEFHVKYVDQNTAYLDGGRSSGLTEGVKLYVKNTVPVADADKSANADAAAAELVVVGVAETSSVTEIHDPKRDVVTGDIAYLSSADVQALVQQNALGATRKYPAVISFTEGGDALDEEARAAVPRPPLPSVNRADLRLGFDYSGIQSMDSSQLTSSGLGGLVQANVTRIGGTFWDLRGYWRGRFTSTSAASQQTLQDLINRTYHLALTYENPNSRWVIGVGRLFLPWASSLNTLDGGYFGARLGHGITTGIFGGSTPDPTSWSYSPNRHIGGAFVNEEGGSFDSIHFSSTAGFGKSFATDTYTTTTATGTTQGSYQDNRPFLFFENSVSYKRTFSIYSAVQADKPSGNPAVPSPGAGLSQSFLTVRFQPFKRIEFNMNETYFRDIPTFDPSLVGTGLLDQYLFQGLSGGVRIEVVKNIVLYTDLGRSSRTGDAQTALNQMYGLTFLKIPKLDLHLDAHYSRFNSSFGSGTYRAFSLSRDLGEGFHLEFLAGDQVFTSSLAGNQNAKFITTNVNTSLGARFFVQAGFTLYRGQLQNYNQWDTVIGYRFDNKWKHK